MGAGAGDTLTARAAPAGPAASPAPSSPDGGSAPAAAQTGFDQVDRRVLRVALSAALVPLVVSAVALVVAVGNSYLPAGDLAMTELHVRDVGHHEVLVGLWSRWDWNHPGPMLFYLLTPFYWLTGGASIGLNLGALVINGAAIAGMVIIARRRGGTPLMLCTLLGSLLLARTLGGEFLHDPWNLYITVFPYALLLFVVWSLACGETWALPGTVVVGSFLVQTHVGFLALVVPLLVWGLAALVWPRFRDRGDESGDRRRWDRWRDLARPGAVAGGVLAVLWFPPILDGLLHSPANLTRIMDYFQDPDDSTNPLSHGWRVISGQFAAIPEWLTHKHAPNPITGEPMAIDSPPLPVLLLPVILAGTYLWRRGRGDGRKLVGTLVVVMVSGVYAVSRTIGPAFDYRLRWTWVPPVLAFVLTTWAGWRAATARWPGIERRLLIPAAVAGCLVLGGVNLVSGARAGVPHEPDSDVVAAITDPVLEALDPEGGQVVVSEYDNSLAGPWYSRSLVLQLERHGFEARVPRDMRVYFSRNRVQDPGPVQARLVVATNEQIDPASEEPGYRLLARWSAIPERDRARLARELAGLVEDWEDGHIATDEYWARATPLREQLAGDGGTTASAVAVFVDES
jgi:hypothetical protein